MQTESEKIISDLDFGQRYTQCGNCSMLTLCHGMYDDCVFSKAIRHIKHQDAELKALTISNKHRLDAWLNAVAEKEKTEVKAYKECLKKIEQRDVSESDFYIMIKKTEFDNLLKEMEGE